MTQDAIRINRMEIPEGAPHKALLGEDPIVLVRRGTTVTAFAGTCPHAGAPLEQGAVCGDRLVCPWHKASFALDDGALIEPPSLGPLARYAVRNEGAFVVVDGTRAPAPIPPMQTRAARGTIAIVGTGAAAAAALAHLAAVWKRPDMPGHVVVIGREEAPPYDRTTLSKMVIAGEMKPSSKPLLPDETFDSSIERIVGEVIRLDAITRRIHLADGRAIAYDRALVATGAVPTPPDLPGAELRGVHVLRTTGDAAALVATIDRASQAVILGASFIGLEIATGLRARNIAVTVVARTTPFATLFGEAIGARIRALHEEKGVVFTANPVARLEGDGDHVARIVHEDGTVRAADLVVLATGVAPETGFVEGVTREDGAIVVGATLEAAPGLYAAGDIARFPYRGRLVSIAHWRLAQQHGLLAARNLAGEHAAFDGVPFFWTAQQGARIDYLGHAEEWDDIVIDGDLGALSFIAFVLRDGRVAAAIACKRDTAVARLAEAMRAELTLAEARAAALGGV